MKVLSKRKGFIQIDLLLWGVALLGLMLISIKAINQYIIPTLHQYQLMDYAKHNFSALEAYYWENVGETQCYALPSTPSITTLIADGFLDSNIKGNSFFNGESPVYRFVSSDDGDLFPAAFEIDIEFYEIKDANQLTYSPYFKGLTGTTMTLRQPFDINDINPNIIEYIGSDGCM